MLRNVKRPLLSLMAVGALFFATANTYSYAAAPTEGEVFVSKSIDDETGLSNSGLPVYKYQPTGGVIQPMLASGGIIWNDAGYYGSSYLVDKAVSEGEVVSKKVFQKYLSQNWSTASQYTWTETNTVTWTYTGQGTADLAAKVKLQLGLSASRSTSYGVGVTIPADSTRFNKLGFASDIFNQFYYWTKTVDGTLVDSKHESIKTPLQDTYLIVYYQ
jgi:hypothetical protein